jgi:hypothetical protein
LAGAFVIVVLLRLIEFLKRRIHDRAVLIASRRIDDLRRRILEPLLDGAAQPGDEVAGVFHRARRTDATRDADQEIVVEAEAEHHRAVRVGVAGQRTAGEEPIATDLGFRVDHELAVVERGHQPLGHCFGDVGAPVRRRFAMTDLTDTPHVVASAFGGSQSTVRESAVDAASTRRHVSCDGGAK